MKLKGMIALLICTLTLFGALSLPSAAASPDDVFVSPAGDDSNPGTFAEPLKTIEAAKEKVKSLAGNPHGEVNVWLRGGTYRISDTLAFTADDLPNVAYSAYADETVEISGAAEISGFAEETVNGVKCFTKQLDTSKEGWYFKSLFNGTTSLQTPRLPKTGNFTVKSVNSDDSLWTEETTPWSFTTGQRSFNADPKDVSKAFHNQNDVVVRILHYWHDEMMFVTGFDEATGRVSLSRPSSMSIRDIDRYYFENVFEALGSPGEWYLDSKTGKLYYVPQPDESAEALVLYGSSLEQLVTIDGVDGITFNKICFRDTDWNIPSPSGNWDGWMAENNIDALQAALDVKGVAVVSNAADTHFVNCEFLNLGGTAIKMLNGVHDSSVENCYFENIAATGIFAGGANVPKGDAGSTYNITIKNNEVYKYGRKFFCAIGIHLTHCDTARVENNEIHDGFYTGISCGWTWGYGYSTTQNLSIKNNLIYQIGQGWLSDMGGIYMLGIQHGTVISGNVIHNVAADPGEGGYGGWGIYLDEGSSYMTIEKNLVFCCGSQGLNIHYGRNNVFKNNISALNAEGQASAGLRDEPMTSSFIGNIFLTKDGAPIYIYMQNKGHFYDNGNIMWDLSKGSCLLFGENKNTAPTVDLKHAKALGCLHNPLVTDPQFADPLGFDFTLSQSSPALAAGFGVWDYDEAGTRADTVVGLTRAGGQTKYADGAMAVEAVPSCEKTVSDYIKSFFNNLFDLIRNLFRK